MYAAPSRATSRGSSEYERFPMTGLAGLLLTSRTGARFIEKPSVGQRLGMAEPALARLGVGRVARAEVPVVARVRHVLDPLDDAALVVDGDQRRQSSGVARDLLQALVDRAGLGAGRRVLDEDDAAGPQVAQGRAGLLGAARRSRPSSSSWPTLSSSVVRRRQRLGDGLLVRGGWRRRRAAVAGDGPAPAAGGVPAAPAPARCRRRGRGLRLAARCRGRRWPAGTTGGGTGLTSGPLPEPAAGSSAGAVRAPQSDGRRGRRRCALLPDGEHAGRRASRGRRRVRRAGHTWDVALERAQHDHRADRHQAQRRAPRCRPPARGTPPAEPRARSRPPSSACACTRRSLGMSPLASSPSSTTIPLVTGTLRSDGSTDRTALAWGPDTASCSSSGATCRSGRGASRSAVLYPRFPDRRHRVRARRRTAACCSCGRRTTATGVRWAAPGGWLDRGESPRQAAVRETFEETGLRVVGRAGAGDRERAVPRGQPGFECRVIGDDGFRAEPRDGSDRLLRAGRPAADDRRDPAPAGADASRSRSTGAPRPPTTGRRGANRASSRPAVPAPSRFAQPHTGEWRARCPPRSPEMRRWPNDRAEVRRGPRDDDDDAAARAGRHLGARRRLGAGAVPADGAGAVRRPLRPDDPPGRGRPGPLARARAVPDRRPAVPGRRAGARTPA